MVKKENTRVQITMNKKNYKYWKAYASRTNQTLSEMINKLLSEYYYSEGIGLK